MEETPLFVSKSGSDLAGGRSIRRRIERELKRAYAHQIARGELRERRSQRVVGEPFEGGEPKGDGGSAEDGGDDRHVRVRHPRLESRGEDG